MVSRLVLAAAVLCTFSGSRALAQSSTPSPFLSPARPARNLETPLATAGGVLHQVQPIVLESPTTPCSTSPAATTSRLVPLPCGDCTYLPPRERDPLRVVPISSTLRPLPAQPLPADPADTAPRLQFTSLASPRLDSFPPASCGPVPCGAPAPPVEVYRPVTCCKPVAATVPDGYVLGKGLIGQPKLYKPGQPVLNVLRFLSL